MIKLSGKQHEKINELAAALCGKSEEYKQGQFFASAELQDRYGIGIEAFIDLVFDLSDYVPTVTDTSTNKKYKMIGYATDCEIIPLFTKEVKHERQV